MYLIVQPHKGSAFATSAGSPLQWYRAGGSGLIIGSMHGVFFMGLIVYITIIRVLIQSDHPLHIMNDGPYGL